MNELVNIIRCGCVTWVTQGREQLWNFGADFKLTCKQLFADFNKPVRLLQTINVKYLVLPAEDFSISVPHGAVKLAISSETRCSDLI